MHPGCSCAARLRMSAHKSEESHNINGSLGLCHGVPRLEGAKGFPELQPMDSFRPRQTEVG